MLFQYKDQSKPEARMKILSYIADKKEMKHVVMVVMAMHILNTKGKGKAIYKELSPPILHDWKQLNEQEYSIKYPGSWNMDMSGKLGTRFVLFSDHSTSHPKFKENVNLIVQDLSRENISLDKFVEVSEKQVKTQITDGKIIESKRICNGCGESHRILYTGISDNLRIKFLQFFWLKNGKAYILTLTCEIDEFDKHLKTAEKVMNSFKLQ